MTLSVCVWAWPSAFSLSPAGRFHASPRAIGRTDADHESEIDSAPTGLDLGPITDIMSAKRSTRKL